MISNAAAVLPATAAAATSAAVPEAEKLRYMLINMVCGSVINIFGTLLLIAAGSLMVCAGAWAIGKCVKNGS